MPPSSKYLISAIESSYVEEFIRITITEWLSFSGYFGVANAFKRLFFYEIMLQTIIRDIKQKKELHGLDDGFVRYRVQDYLREHSLVLDGDYAKLKRTKAFKELFKTVRKQCRQVYGVFQDVRDERSSFVYAQIFKKLGKINSVLDLGCGEAPFEYCLLQKHLSYFLTDINADMVQRLTLFLKEKKLKGKAFIFNAVDDKVKKLPCVDVVFLLRTLESLEYIQRNISKQILHDLQCKQVVVSFAKVALGEKKKIQKSGRAWFRKALKELGYVYEIADIDKEILFFIRKI